MIQTFNSRPINKKVLNATKVEVDGIKYDSKIESYMGGRLKQFKIPHEFQKEIVLQPKFEYLGKAIRDIRIIVDYYLGQFNIIIDTKGHQTDENKVKHKLLKYIYYSTGNEMLILLPNNKQECDSIINQILSHQEKQNKLISTIKFKKL